MIPIYYDMMVDQGSKQAQESGHTQGWKCGGGPIPGIQCLQILARGLGLDPGPRPRLAAPRPAVRGLGPGGGGSQKSKK